MPREVKKTAQSMKQPKATKETQPRARGAPVKEAATEATTQKARASTGPPKATAAQAKKQRQDVKKAPPKESKKPPAKSMTPPGKARTERVKKAAPTAKRRPRTAPAEILKTQQTTEARLTVTVTQTKTLKTSTTPKSSTPKRTRTPSVKTPKRQMTIRGRRGAERKVETIESEEYYHGLLPREDVKLMLRNDGDFIVRHTEVNNQKNYVISVQCDGQAKHVVIKQTTDGDTQFVVETNLFGSVLEVINHYMQKPLGAGLKTPTILKTPITKAAWELKHSQVELAEKLGEGAFGEVHKGILELADGSKVTVAVKSSRLSGLKKSEIAEMMKETRLMRKYNHPNVVKFYGVAAEEEPILIVMELVSGGSVDKYVQKKKDTLTVEQLTKLCVDAARGLKYLHEENCVHRDIAARNCLIADDGTVKIADFGLSFQGDAYKCNKKKKVPIKWLAPETLTSQIYTSSTDVWSFGVMMWEVFSFGTEPYPGMTGADVQREVKHGYRMEPPAAMPEQIQQIMNKCWLEKAEQRPNFTQIVAHLTDIGNSVLPN